jgi:hypothetical protein
MSRTELSDWTQWKEKCALDLCDEEPRNRLGAYAHAHFIRYIKVYDENLQHPKATGQNGTYLWDAWHMLEVHSVTSGTQDGKSYKDWLFDKLLGRRIDCCEAVLECNASLLIRTVVRQYCTKEGNWATNRNNIHLRSFDLPVTPGSDRTLADLVSYLLPEKAELELTEAERNDFEAIAEAFAGRFYEQMDEREKIVGLAKVLGITLTDPVVTNITGCKKTQLYAARDKMDQRLNNQLEQDFPDEDPEALRILKQFIASTLAEKIISWAKPEKMLQPIFSLYREHERSMP